MLNSQTPLIVVDMQNGFVNSKSSHVVEPVGALVSTWARLGWPIYFTRFINEVGSQWEEWLDWHRLQTSPETDIIPTLAKSADDAVTFEKTRYSCVTGPVLDAMTRDAWSEVVICGVATDGCVMESAVDFFERRIRPLVVVDACASHAGDEIHKMGLTLLTRSIGPRQLVTMKELLGLLPRS